MRSKLIAFLLSFTILPAAGATLRGTPIDAFEYVPHEEIARRQMTTWPGEVYASAFMNDHETFFVEFVKRLDHGNYVERHSHWIDQTTILDGDAILTYGGSLDDAKEFAPTEFRGPHQTGGKVIHMHPGDFVLIPPNTPHHFDALPGKVLHYVVFKHRV